MPRRAVRAESREIAGPAGALEALVEQPSASVVAAAVVCHPHPLHGGSMQNKVVHTLARSFQALGAATVRFNFRGVGGSAGAYAEGAGELDDALAVAAWATRRWPAAALYLAGFSFGAAVALQAAARSATRGLVTVALPVARVPLATFAAPRSPWLAVHGELDELVALADVERWLAAVGADTTLVVIEGATHFFHGKLGALAREVEAFFARDFAASSLPARAGPGPAESGRPAEDADAQRAD